MPLVLHRRLGAEAQALEVLVEADPRRGLLDDVLGVALADLLVLLGLEHGELLLLEPVGADLRLLGRRLLLVGAGHLHALVLVVLREGGCLGLLGLDLLGLGLFGLPLNSSLGLRLGLVSLLDVLVLLEFVLEVSDLSPASAFLAGPVAE